MPHPSPARLRSPVTPDIPRVGVSPGSSLELPGSFRGDRGGSHSELSQLRIKLLSGGGAGPGNTTFAHAWRRLTGVALPASRRHRSAFLCSLTSMICPGLPTKRSPTTPQGQHLLLGQGWHCSGQAIAAESTRTVHHTRTRPQRHRGATVPGGGSAGRASAQGSTEPGSTLGWFTTDASKDSSIVEMWIICRHCRLCPP